MRVVGGIGVSRLKCFSVYRQSGSQAGGSGDVVVVDGSIESLIICLVALEPQ